MVEITTISRPVSYPKMFRQRLRSVMSVGLITNAEKAQPGFPKQEMLRLGRWIVLRSESSRTEN